MALKAIIEEHGDLAGISLGKKDHNHKLPELWELFVKIATAFSNDCLDAAATAVARCIEEFGSVDATSTAFRYVRNLTTGDPFALPREGLDLVKLHDVMNGIENFFKCVDLAFTHQKELAAEEYARKKGY